MIKVLLLDADGVLINVEGKMASRHFEKKYGIPHRKTVDFYHGPFVDCKVGKKDMFEVLPRYLKEWGWKKSTQDFVTEWFEFENKLNNQLINYIKILKKKRISCWLATNQEKHRTDYFMESMGLKNHLDGIFASAHLGHLKPARQFFTSVLDKLSVESKEILFWDDSVENVEASKAVGMNAELYENFKDFTMKMKYYLKELQ